MTLKRKVLRKQVAQGSWVAAALTLLGCTWVWWLANDPPELSGPFAVETSYGQEVGTSADHVQCAAVRHTEGPAVTDVRIGEGLEALAEQEEITVEDLGDGLVSSCDRQRDRRVLIAAMVTPVVVALAAATVALRVWLRRLQPAWKRAADTRLPDDLALDRPRPRTPSTAED
jgi:hypothetical protein